MRANSLLAPKSRMRPLLGGSLCHHPTPKLMPSATCHSGMVGGSVSENSTEVTKKIRPMMTETLDQMAGWA